KKVRAAYLADAYTPEELREEMASIRAKREALEDGLEAWQRQVAAQAEREAAIEEAINLCEELREDVEQATPEGKRRILEELGKEVSLDREGKYRVDFHFERPRFGRVTREMGTASRSVHW